jgi:hypothetical protein
MVDSVTIDEIMNFNNYFKACDGEMDFGKHGPEIIDGKIYISIFHYLEFKQMNPRNFDTFNLGKWLTEQSISKIIKCKYSCQSFDINKFDVEMLFELEDQFINFRK